MLQDARSKLEVVNDEVCALRALVADPSVPTGPVPESHPLPAPRSPPRHLLDSVHVNSEDEWSPVGRAGNWVRRNNSGVIWGYT